MAVGRLTLFFLCVAVAGCHTTPVIENVTGFTATDIQRKARCELRDAIEDKVAAWFASHSLKDDAYAQSQAPLLKDDLISLANVDFKKLLPTTRSYLNYVMGAAVAYDFDLNITETNDVDLSMDVLGAVTGNKIKLGIGAGVDRMRRHEQAFYLVETFDHLTRQVDFAYCDPEQKRKKNPHFFNERPDPLYPIAGLIGLKKPLDEFVDLSLFSPFGANDKTKPPTLASTLEFTTKVYGNLTPGIVAEPNLTDSSVASKNSREDVHKITLGFSIENPPSLDVAENTGKFVVSQGTKAEKAAAGAASNFILRTEFNRPTVIIDR
ncbi:hypothetical protein [Mesorhizobium sp. B2-8-5]|uniref:hypothetical protein n=1 Tax=Mesorhizobium sp. B2-8-5 TaxID=2589903 RepID=UPI0011269DFF|nr:hypothetical protein [Mesorhizobium sp. B2-8-5]UCI25808.1 hypothetical protein FJ430_30370 [Mesorhizobium sp. B2-8-5]